MPGSAALDRQVVQSIGVAGPRLIPTRRVVGLDLGSDDPCLANLRAYWRILDRAQKLSVELRVLEIDLHGSRALVTIFQSAFKIFIAALCPGIPLTAPPRIALDPQKKTFS